LIISEQKDIKEYKKWFKYWSVQPNIVIDEGMTEPKHVTSGYNW